MPLKSFLIISIISISVLLTGITQVFAEEPPVTDTVELETSEEYSFKIAVEKHLESKLNTVLREVTGIKNLVAVVDASVEALARPKEDKRVDKKEINVLFLPGVPARADSTYFADSSERPPIVVRKLAVKVMVDQKVSNSLTDLVHDVAISLVGFNPDRGDTLEVQTMEFMQGKENIPTHVIYTAILALPVIFFMIAAGLFFLSPYKKLTLALKDAGIGQESGAVVQSSPQSNITPTLTPILAPAQAASITPESDAKSGIGSHFAFANRMGADEIIFAMQDLKPDDKAIAINFISTELAADVLARLDEPTRKEIVISLTQTTTLERDKVLSVESALKDKMEFISGDPARMAAILENSDEDLRDNLLDVIENKDKKAALTMIRLMVTFESIIRKSSPESVDALVRRFPSASFARVLTASPADVQNKVLESLGRGASELMREELKYSTPLRGQKLRREKHRIITEFRAMNEAGLIDEQFADSGHEQ